MFFIPTIEISFFTFFGEIMNWARDAFSRLSSNVKKAWVYIRRVPGGIRQMLRYIQNGLMLEQREKKEVDWDEIVRIHNNGDIDDETFNALKEEHDKRIGVIERGVDML